MGSFQYRFAAKNYGRNVGADLCVRPQVGHTGPPLKKLSIERYRYIRGRG